MLYTSSTRRFIQSCLNTDRGPRCYNGLRRVTSTAVLLVDLRSEISNPPSPTWLWLKLSVQNFSIMIWNRPSQTMGDQGRVRYSWVQPGTARYSAEKTHHVRYFRKRDRCGRRWMGCRAPNAARTQLKESPMPILLLHCIPFSCQKYSSSISQSW